MKNPSSRHGMWRLAGASSTALFILFVGNAGRMLMVDAPQPSEVMLVLAGETDHRPAVAMQLLEQGLARRMIIDVPATQRVYGFGEVELAKKYFQSLPHSAEISVCPIEGLSTKDES